MSLLLSGLLSIRYALLPRLKPFRDLRFRADVRLRVVNARRDERLPGTMPDAL